MVTKNKRVQFKLTSHLKKYTRVNHSLFFETRDLDIDVELGKYHNIFKYQDAIIICTIGVK